MDAWLEAVRNYFEIRNRAWVNLETIVALKALCTSAHTKWYTYVDHLVHRKYRALELQGKRLLRVHSALCVREAQTSRRVVVAHVEETIYWVYQDGTKFTVEARVLEHHQEWVCTNDVWLMSADKESNELEKYTPHASHTTATDSIHGADVGLPWSDATSFTYSRVKAIRYAELWWNAVNPLYPVFHDDATNFVSQSLLAGRLNTSSHSWATAHALFHFVTKLVSAVRVPTAKELKMGDIIFYDWDGQGKFHHAAIVTDFDEYGDPLVNAHADASYHRPYTYFDSRAWTKRTRYGFVHLPDQLP